MNRHAYMKFTLTVLLLFAIACAPVGRRAGAPLQPALSSLERTEVIGLIQYDNEKGAYITDREIETIARALRLVREAFPQGRDITVRHSSGLEIQLSDSGARVMQGRLSANWQGDTVLSVTGLSSVDSLHHTLGVSRVSVHAGPSLSGTTWFIRPLFPHPIYRNTIAAQYRNLAGVHLSWYGLMMGDGGGLDLKRTSHGLQFELSRKWGDCPAGCILGHVWVFEVDLRSNRVTKIRDSGDPWPIPPAT